MPTHHANDVPVDGLREDAPAGGDVVDDLVEGGPLDLLALELGIRRLNDLNPLNLSISINSKSRHFIRVQSHSPSQVSPQIHTHT